jgi:hexulose-6-phosphate isomerase
MTGRENRPAAAARLGFMQGRLSPLVDGRIQAFPWGHWREELPAAAKLGLGLIEWTLDHERLAENPLMTGKGRAEVRALSSRHGVRVCALTGDLFMQAPFWKAKGAACEQLLAELDRVLDACGDLGIGIVVVPLVDNGSLTTAAQAQSLAAGLLPRAEAIARRGIVVAFESDFPPDRLAAFIAGYPALAFALNYDIGNSAALGFDSGAEIAAYAPRIAHVHVKDRIRGGTTVPLGTGNADLPRAIGLIERSGYRGNYVLQTARAADGDHAGALARYRDLTLGLIAAGA